MNCCQCQGIEKVFSEPYVGKELKRYRKKGPGKTTRMLVKALKKENARGLTLLDIGGGVGAIQHELLDAGAERATSVEASAAYQAAAQAEAERRGLAERVAFHYGDFIELAPRIGPADLVTLDRVICCYPDMENMLRLSAARARKLYGLVYPRDNWWLKLALAGMNFISWLRRNPYRGYVHPTKAVEAVLAEEGLKRSFYRRTLVWQVAVYTR